MSELKKKNCHNCKHGYVDSDGEYGEYQYFVCEKRTCESIEFENNLTRPEYLEKAKVCCDLRVDPVEVKCAVCREDEWCWKEDKENFICFECFVEKESKLEQGVNK